MVPFCGKGMITFDEVANRIEERTDSFPAMKTLLDLSLYES